jgi:cell division initiation protein
VPNFVQSASQFSKQSMITPIDIRQHTFKKGLRGYDPDEVRAYLEALSREWEAQLELQKRMKQELEQAKARLSSFEQMENILHKTLQQAEQAAKSTQESSQREAEITLREARQQAQQVLSTLEKERSQVQQSTQALLLRRDEVFSQMKSFLAAQLERLTSFERFELILPSLETQPRGYATIGGLAQPAERPAQDTPSPPEV